MSEQTHEDHDLDPATATLVAALVEIERHVGGSGWDQPIRLFALARTDDLIRQEPSLAAHLSVGRPDGLSSIEQEDFRAGKDLGKSLLEIQWPPTVNGCAIVVERNLLPASYDAELPADADQAAQIVATHPHRECIRLVVGVLRDGSRYGIGRAMNHSEKLLDGGPDFAPDLLNALWGTLR